MVDEAVGGSAFLWAVFEAGAGGRDGGCRNARREQGNANRADAHHRTSNKLREQEYDWMNTGEESQKASVKSVQRCQRGRIVHQDGGEDEAYILYYYEVHATLTSSCNLVVGMPSATHANGLHKS